MLKDVGMTGAKSRETRTVYMQQHRGLGHACNNNNMCNPKLKDVGRVTHVINREKLIPMDYITTCIHNHTPLKMRITNA